MEVVLWVYLFLGMGVLVASSLLLAFVILHPHARELLGAPPCGKCRMIDKL